jgi:hypothetical protein
MVWFSMARRGLGLGAFGAQHERARGTKALGKNRTVEISRQKGQGIQIFPLRVGQLLESSILTFRRVGVKVHLFLRLSAGAEPSLT